MPALAYAGMRPVQVVQPEKLLAASKLATQSLFCMAPFTCIGMYRYLLPSSGHCFALATLLSMHNAPSGNQVS